MVLKSEPHILYDFGEIDLVCFLKLAPFSHSAPLCLALVIVCTPHKQLSLGLPPPVQYNDDVVMMSHFLRCFLFLNHQPSLHSTHTFHIYIYTVWVEHTLYVHCSGSCIKILLTIIIMMFFPHMCTHIHTCSHLTAV